MTIDFGSINNYHADRGFGFVRRTFSNPNGKVFFHIKKIKKKHPELAQKLDNSEALETVNFWYEIETTEKGEQVSKLWLNADNIPQSYTHELCGLIQRVESIWKKVDSSKPSWLDLVTIELVGVDRRHELSVERDNLESQLRAAEEERRREAEEQKCLQRQAKIAQKNTQRKNQIPLVRDRFRSERGAIEAIFASNEMHGLPPELQRIVRPCPRFSRTHPLSHQPGGSDVVVAYSLGDAILYDWIKNVNWYISSFEKQDPNFHLHIVSIYGRFYEDPDERGIGVFCPIWTHDKNGTLKSAVKACISRYQRQMEIGRTTLHQQAKQYWKNKYGLSEQEVENLPTIYKQYRDELLRSLIV
ncbi:MAG: hypothetical protein RMX96_30140 [Nostoc sp. ChiSLP02]|nr:hypothetical protein [Nostoc sp. DedSLP05]MDZ8100485.1 hypothetical protein [Nostoc sp. DedSLP01]MDZ8189091.1 hypothetical protein [Nostoc sp. ChiSLP02]